MLVILRILIPLLLIVWGLMAVWIYLLNFPWHWVAYTVAIIELLLACLVISMEYDADKVSGASGWSTFGWIYLNICLAVILGLARLVVWIVQKI